MNKKILLTTLLLAQCSFAGNMGSTMADRNYLVSLSIGPVWPSNTSWQTLYMTPDIEKTFTSGNSKSALVDGELFLGMQQNLGNYLMWTDRLCCCSY